MFGGVCSVDNFKLIAHHSVDAKLARRRAYADVGEGWGHGEGHGEGEGEGEG